MSFLFCSNIADLSHTRLFSCGKINNYCLVHFWDSETRDGSDVVTTFFMTFVINYWTNAQPHTVYCTLKRQNMQECAFLFFPIVYFVHQENYILFWLLYFVSGNNIGKTFFLCLFGSVWYILLGTCKTFTIDFLEKKTRGESVQWQVIINFVYLSCGLFFRHNWLLYCNLHPRCTVRRSQSFTWSIEEEVQLCG